MLAAASATRRLLPRRVAGCIGARGRARPSSANAAHATGRHSPLPPPRTLPGSLAAPSALGTPPGSRPFAAAAVPAGLSEAEYKARLDDFQDLFAEARLSLEDVRESEGTTYFEEDLDQSIEDVDKAIGAFQGLVAELDEERKGALMRSQGLKVEQLKGELKMIMDSDHH